MIEVVFDKNGFIASGHADFDEYGKDIVCSAISSVLQHTANVLVLMGAKIDRRKGYLKVWEIPMNECTDKILKATLGFLIGIQRKYPKNLYVEVR